MMMVMVTMMVNICDDDCDLVIKVISVKEVMSCDVSPVAMFLKLVSYRPTLGKFRGGPVKKITLYLILYQLFEAPKLPNIFVGVCVRKLCDIAEVQDLLLEQ